MKIPLANNFNIAYKEIMEDYWPCIAGKTYEEEYIIEVMHQHFIKGYNIYLPFIHRGIKVELVNKDKWIK